MLHRGSLPKAVPTHQAIAEGPGGGGALVRSQPPTLPHVRPPTHPTLPVPSTHSHIRGLFLGLKCRSITGLLLKKSIKKGALRIEPMAFSLAFPCIYHWDTTGLCSNPGHGWHRALFFQKTPTHFGFPNDCNMTTNLRTLRKPKTQKKRAQPPLCLVAQNARLFFCPSPYPSTPRGVGYFVH